MEDRTTTYIGGGVIVILLFLTIYGFVSNSKNKKNLLAEQAQTENLRNDNQQVKEELDKLKNEYGSLSSKSDSTSKKLASTEEKVSQSNRRIAALSKENKTLNQSKLELEELQKSKAELDNTYANLQREYDRSIAQYKDLENKLAATETQRNDVIARLEKTEMYNADYFLVTATKGKNDKLVNRASKVDKLSISFNVPQNLKDSVTYRIETPAGTALNPTSFFIPKDEQHYTAGLYGVFHEIKSPREVSLTYIPEEKLEKGEYRIQLISNGNPIGNCRLTLR